MDLFQCKMIFNGSIFYKMSEYMTKQRKKNVYCKFPANAFLIIMAFNSLLYQEWEFLVLLFLNLPCTVSKIKCIFPLFLLITFYCVFYGYKKLCMLCIFIVLFVLSMIFSPTFSYVLWTLLFLICVLCNMCIFIKNVRTDSIFLRNFMYVQFSFLSFCV